MRFVIVSGMSGAGKSTALKCLEDMGYFCVDNLPLKLILPFARLSTDGTAPELNKVAIGIDVRSAESLSGIEPILRELTETGVAFEILYLDASDDVLIRRYKETRRLHPMSGGGRIRDGIALEREATGCIRKRADCIIDTSQMLTRDLHAEMTRIFSEGGSFRHLYVTILSFGFKFGIPVDADLVVDVRFLPNPYYDHSLRGMTGNDAPVRDFVMSSPESGIFLDKYEDLLRFLIPNYIKEGKNQLVIAVGCTGGRHRSVALANALAERLSGSEIYGVRTEHRDLARDTVRKSFEYRQASREDREE